MRRALLMAAMIAAVLAGCRPPATNSAVSATPEPPAANAAAPSATNSADAPPAPAAPRITGDGYGPLRVGMTWEEAHAAMPSLERQVEEMMEACYHGRSPELPGVWVMFVDRRLARVTADQGSTIAGPEGVTVGTPVAEVRRIFGDRVSEERHHYEDPPAAYLTLWTERPRRGVRFVINGRGVVSEIHGGGEQIQYIEGCS